MNNRKKPISYKPKKSKKAGFSSTKNIMPTIVTIAAAGVICCFGYAIAKPILSGSDSISTNADINDGNGSADSTSSPEDSSVTTTKGTTGLVVINGSNTETTTKTTVTTVTASKNNDDSSNAVHTGEGIDGVGSSSGNSNSSNNTVNGGSSGNGNSSNNTVNGGSSSVSDVYKSVQCSVRLPESAVNDADSLRSILEDVKSKYPNAGAVVIPMKLQGGELNYSSNAAGDAAYVVCKGSMTASEIVKIVRDEGLYAYASCSMLEDHLYSSVYTYWHAGYRVEKNGVLTGDQWYDYYPDQGGQPWLDPNSDLTISYLEGIVKELSSSGFSAILCSDIKYPDFAQADEKYLNPDIYAKNPDALINLANALEAASSGTTDIVLDLSGYNAINGNELVYDPSKLDVSYVLFETSSGDASAISSWASSHSAGISVSLSYTDGSGSGHCVINY